MLLLITRMAIVMLAVSLATQGFMGEMTPAIGAIGWLAVAIATLVEVIQEITISRLNNRLIEKKEEETNAEE